MHPTMDETDEIQGEARAACPCLTELTRLLARLVAIETVAHDGSPATTVTDDADAPL